MEASAKSEVLSTTVRTMGKVVDYDRPFKVEIDQEGTTAVEGKHYEVAFDTMVIPAGKSSAEVQIRFFSNRRFVGKDHSFGFTFEG